MQSFDIRRASRGAARNGAAAVVLLILALPLGGCATSIMDGIWGDDSSSTAAAGVGTGLSPDMATAAEGEAVAKLYNEALESLKKNNYKTAAKEFGEVERQYPYSSYATKAILMQAYVNYKAKKYDDAIVAANRFITLHPGHKDAAYAIISSRCPILSRSTIPSAIRRPRARRWRRSRRSSAAFPDTPYAEDASQKVLVARDHLAGKEMEIGRYYYKQGSYLAGINRFKRVVTEYQNTTQTPEALYRLSEGYMALGVVSEAQTAAAVLGHNFPNSEWYKDAYQLVSSDGLAPVENKESWISKTFRAINPL